jgi:hypothetical protein
MPLRYEKITSTIAFFLFLMNDHEKSSEALFEMVEERNKSYIIGEKSFEEIKDFVLDIVEIISLIDPEYSEKMAKNYYDLVTGQK